MSVEDQRKHYEETGRPELPTERELPPYIATKWIVATNPRYEEFREVVKGLTSIEDLEVFIETINEKNPAFKEGMVLIIQDRIKEIEKNNG